MPKYHRLTIRNMTRLTFLVCFCAHIIHLTIFVPGHVNTYWWKIHMVVLLIFFYQFSKDMSYLLIVVFVADPIEPQAPSILERSDTTITISLNQVQDEAVSFYRIIVQQTNTIANRVKRGIYDKNSWRQIGFPDCAEPGIKCIYSCAAAEGPQS